MAYIQICNIDHFQGEENDIIFLSLVYNNNRMNNFKGEENNIIILSLVCSNKAESIHHCDICMFIYDVSAFVDHSLAINFSKKKSKTYHLVM